MPRLALIEDLTTGPIPLGSHFLVEFDSASQWYNASITIADSWLRTGGRVDYNTFTQPPGLIRAQLRQLGQEPENLEREETLSITDWYTATLGQKSQEKYSHQTLKMSELSLYFAQTHLRAEPESDRLYISDDDSTFARFNDEKAWVEVELTRIIPAFKVRKAFHFTSIMKGVHSEWVYKQLEGVSEGVIDFKVEESGEGVRSAMRIRIMRNAGFDSRWHQLKISNNFQVTLEK